MARIGLIGSMLIACSGAAGASPWSDRFGDTSHRGIALETGGAATVAAARRTRSLAEPLYELYRFGPSGELLWRVDLATHPSIDPAVYARLAPGRSVETAEDFLSLWSRQMNDADPLHRNLLPLPQTAVGGVVLGDSLLGLWRVGDNGKVYWHRPLIPSLGLSLMTELAVSGDQATVVGGLGVADEGGCATAAILQVDAYGFITWRWRFDGGRATYPVRLERLANDRTLALVTSAQPNRYLIAWGDTPCPAPRAEGQWLVWIDADGSTVRIVEMPPELFVLGIAALPDGRAVVAAWGPRDLVLQTYDVDGELLAERAYNRRRDFGWSEDALPFGRFEMQAWTDRIELLGAIGCDPKAYGAWLCPGQGLKLLALRPDLRLRTMPATLDGGWRVAHGAWNTFELVRPSLRATFDRLATQPAQR
jgi:hypothetical protein